MSHNEDNALTNSSVSESFWGFMRFVFVTRISNNNKASVRLILTPIEINVSFLHLASSPFSSVSFHSKTRCVCVCAFFGFSFILQSVSNGIIYNQLKVGLTQQQ